MKLQIEKTSNNALTLKHADKPAGLLKACIWRPGNTNYHIPQCCTINSFNSTDQTLQCHFICEQENIKATLNLSANDHAYSGKLTASGTGHAVIALIWELPQEDIDFPFMPGFMYGDNAGGKHPAALYPQLSDTHHNDRTKPWLANEWRVRADRSSHGLTSMIGKQLTYAFAAKDVARYNNETIAEKNGLAISSRQQHRLIVSLGFANSPMTYSALPQQNYVNRPEGFVNLNTGPVTADVNLILFPSQSRHQSASKLLRQAYALLHDDVPSDGELENAVTDIANALVNHGYSEQAKNFYVEIHSDTKERPISNIFTTGWTGGIQAAFPLLRAGRQLNNQKMIQCAQTVISNIAQNGRSEKSNLFFENYDSKKQEWNVRGWWLHENEASAHSGYVNGQICHYMLKAYLLEKQYNNEQTSWYHSAKKVLDHIAAAQGQHGQFGCLYNLNDGAISDDNGFSGCWFVPAFATLHQIDGDEKYLKIAHNAINYYRKFVKDFHVYGCPHDAFKSPDEEGILAWINAAHILHKNTNKKQYLDDLLMGLDYEFSWKFAYNVQNEVEPLKSMNWASTGGSITSVNNSHIHPMGSAIANCILYAAQKTNDNYYWARLADTIHWTLNAYLHHDGQFGWGKKGLINERFCYTDSLLAERFPDGTPSATWFCGHAWASGSVLEGLTGNILDLFRSDRKKLLG